MRKRKRIRNLIHLPKSHMSQLLFLTQILIPWLHAAAAFAHALMIESEMLPASVASQSDAESCSLLSKSSSLLLFWSLSPSSNSWMSISHGGSCSLPSSFYAQLPLLQASWFISSLEITEPPEETCSTLLSSPSFLFPFGAYGTSFSSLLSTREIPSTQESVLPMMKATITLLQREPISSLF